MAALAPSAGTAVPPWTLAVAAMLSVQLGSALSVELIDAVGAAGTEPWQGAVALAALAAVAAVGWAGYVVLTQQVGDGFTGISARVSGSGPDGGAWRRAAIRWLCMSTVSATVRLTINSRSGGR